MVDILSGELQYIRLDHKSIIWHFEKKRRMITSVTIQQINRLTHLPWDKMASVSQIVFSDAFFREWKVLYHD